MIVKWGNDASWELDKQSNPHEAGFLKLDCSKAAQKLKWQPRWDLEFSLNDIIDWNKKYINKEDMKLACIDSINKYNSTY